MIKILLLGPPRSGSTWVSEILAATPGAERSHEPDSDPHVPFALLAKAGIGRFPVLGADDVAPRYRALWEAAVTPAPDDSRYLSAAARSVLRTTNLDVRNRILCDRPSWRSRLTSAALERTARPASPPTADILIVKSVHSPASAGFVTSVTDASVVVVRRNPLNAVASWLELGWEPQYLGGSPRDEARAGEIVGCPPPAPDAPLVARQAWVYSALTRLLDLEAQRHPEWTVIQHEDLCRAPLTRFEHVFERLGLDMSDEVVTTLREQDESASGYSTKRIAAEQPDRWKHRLDDDQVELIRATAAAVSVEC